VLDAIVPSLSTTIRCSVALATRWLKEHAAPGTVLPTADVVRARLSKSTRIVGIVKTLCSLLEE